MSDEPECKKAKTADATISPKPFPAYTSLLEFAVDGKQCPAFRESHVGIHHFLTGEVTTPFTGKLKSMFTDFVVREVDPNGLEAVLGKTEYTRAEIDILNGLEPEPERDVAKDKLELATLLSTEIVEKLTQLVKGDAPLLIPAETTEKLDKPA